MNTKKIGVLLSGCGVYDGAEIQEAVFAMLAIEQNGWQVVPIAIDAMQYHVVNHLTGEVVENEKRNMLVEAARIARGNITELGDVEIDQLTALVIPGGFGSAKNFTTWAFDGADSKINEDLKQLIQDFHATKKVIVALCVSPVVLAKAFEGTHVRPSLTIGSNQEDSPYDIAEFSAGLEKNGATTSMRTKNEIQIDEVNRIITAPCYMMDASLSEVYKNVCQAIEAIKTIER